MTIIFNVHSNGKHLNVLTNPRLPLVSFIPVNRSECSIVTSKGIHLLCGLVFEKPYPLQQRSQLLLSTHFSSVFFVCLFVCFSKPEDTIGCRLIFCGWKAKVSTRLQISKFDKAHYQVLCGAPTEERKGKWIFYFFCCIVYYTGTFLQTQLVDFLLYKICIILESW